MDDDDDDELIPPDVRRHRRLLDSRRQADGELSDSDDEGEGGRRNHKSDRDSDEKLGTGMVGILAAGPTSAHAGPSGQTTVERILSSKMDVDEQED